MGCGTSNAAHPPQETLSEEEKKRRESLQRRIKATREQEQSKQPRRPDPTLQPARGTQVAALDAELCVKGAYITSSIGAIDSAIIQESRGEDEPQPTEVAIDQINDPEQLEECIDQLRVQENENVIKQLDVSLLEPAYAELVHQYQFIKAQRQAAQRRLYAIEEQVANGDNRIKLPPIKTSNATTLIPMAEISSDSKDEMNSSALTPHPPTAPRPPVDSKSKPFRRSVNKASRQEGSELKESKSSDTSINPVPPEYAPKKKVPCRNQIKQNNAHKHARHIASEHRVDKDLLPIQHHRHHVIYKQKTCHICETETANIYCENCNDYYCTINECDVHRHETPSLRKHIRLRVKFESRQSAASLLQDLFKKQAAPLVSDRTRKGLPYLCNVCEVEEADVYCEVCEDYFCTLQGCDVHRHETPSLREHTRVPYISLVQVSCIRPPQKSNSNLDHNTNKEPHSALSGAGSRECSVCEVEPATVFCKTCHDYFCRVNECDSTHHSIPSKRQHLRLPYKPLSAGFSLDNICPASLGGVHIWHNNKCIKCFQFRQL